MKLLKCQKGSVLMMTLIIGIIAFIGALFIMQRQLSSMKFERQGQVFEARMYLLNQLSDLLIQEITIRNSRFSTNAQLHQCITGIPTPCDENQRYDMILYAPNPPVSYQGGPWPAPPVGITPVAGGLTGNKLFFTPSGGRCFNGGALTEPNSACPIQAIVQFRPLCGGTPDIPAPGPCTGAAYGFEVFAGVGIYFNGYFSYQQKEMDQVVFRFNSKQLSN